MTANDDVEMDTHDDEQERVPMTLSGQELSSRILTSDSLKQQQQQADPEQPHFPKLNAVQASGVEYRRVRCPPHRYTPLREHWEQILTPLVEYLKLQVRQRDAHIAATHFASNCYQVCCTRDDVEPTLSESFVLFLELQTLREASELDDGDGALFQSLSDVQH